MIYLGYLAFTKTWRRTYKAIRISTIVKWIFIAIIFVFVTNFYFAKHLRFRLKIAFTKHVTWTKNDTLNDLAKEMIQRYHQFKPKPEDIKFLESHVNPCWKVNNYQWINCLPLFYFGGFPRCSTTDLFQRLVLHPRISNPGKTNKEVNFWTANNTEMTLTDYSSIYDEVSENKDQFALDGTVFTFDSSRWAEGFIERGEGPVLPPHLIFQYVPNAKYIVIVREPAARLYSQYNYEYRRNPEDPDHTPLLFHETVRQYIRIFQNCTETHGAHRCAYFRGKDLYREHHMKTIQLRHGLYAVFIKDVLQLVPRENILVIRHEDYVQDRRKSLSEILNFMGLEGDEEIVQTMTGEVFLANSVQGQESKSQGVDTPFSERVSDAKRWPMWPETEKMVKEFYKPYNHELADLLRDDRFLFED